jgi:hypothetical protein
MLFFILYFILFLKVGGIKISKSAAARGGKGDKGEINHRF